MANSYHGSRKISTTNPNGNQPSIILNREENDLLFAVIGDRCLSLSSAVAQVLFSDPASPSRWVKQFCGVACFVKDNPKKSFFIRIYDIVEHGVLWEQELYHEINYQQALPFFHTFETDDRQAGLNFANEDEAYHFFSMVHEKVRLLHRRREDNLRKRDGLNNNHSAKVDNNRHNAQNSHPVSTAQSVQVPFPTGNSNGRSNGFTETRKKSTKAKRITKNDIGMPTNFQHVSHIGWDPDKGFEYDDSDPILQELFKKAGIDMKKTDAATRSFIYGFIEKELGGVNAVKKAAVHPPSHASSIPPPPPRSQPRVPNQVSVLQPNVASRPLPPPRTPPTNPRPPAGAIRAGPPVPLVAPGLTAGVKPQAPALPRGPPAPAKPVVNGGSHSSTAVPPAPPPPPPPPPCGGPPTSLGGAIPAAPSVPPGGSPVSPGSPEASGDSRSALMDEIRKGKGLKPVEPAQKDLSGRDKLLNEIQNPKPLKHVDPEKDSLGKGEAAQQLDGMAAALAKALALRRDKIDYQDDSDGEQESGEDDDEWDC